MIPLYFLDKLGLKHAVLFGSEYAVKLPSGDYRYIGDNGIESFSFDDVGIKSFHREMAIEKWAGDDWKPVRIESLKTISKEQIDSHSIDGQKIVYDHKSIWYEFDFSAVDTDSKLKRIVIKWVSLMDKKHNDKVGLLTDVLRCSDQQLLMWVYEKLCIYDDSEISIEGFSDLMKEILK
jgi:hypothetical protein